MQEIQIGDKVRFLNDIGGGKVTGFQKGGIVLVEDEDGFEVPMLQSQVVVIAPSPASLPMEEKGNVSHQKEKNKEEREEEPTEEDLRIAELREMYKKETRKTQVVAQPVSPAKPAKEETPEEEQESLEARVIRLEMTVRRLQMRLERLEDAKALREKVKADTREHRELKHVSKNDIIEIDLHADEILESTMGMGARDIKEYQLDVFRRTMKEHENEKGRKIVFIHGNGEGVLRKAIIDELRRTYKKCEYQDASFLQYGFGATMVIVS